MKKRSTPSSPSASSIMGIAAIAIVSFVIGYGFHAKHSMYADDRMIMIKATDRLSDTAYAFPKSNIEWLTANIAMTPKSHTKNSVISTTIHGVVTNTSEAHGEVAILSKHYFVGTPGSYAYHGALTLDDHSGNTRTFYFSPKRMNMMKVVRVQNTRETPATFKDIKSGDAVEVEEAVELTKSNINDENLLSLTVRILR
jgi:hypothetical protein